MRIGEFCKAVEDLVEAVRQKHGSHDQSTHGHGGGGGGYERYRDRIEGTQAEADREVKKYVKKAEQAKAALDEAKSRLQSSEAKTKVKVLEGALKSVQDRKADLERRMEESKARIAALKAKLKKSKEDVLKELGREVGVFEKIVGEVKSLNRELDDLIEKIEEL